MRSFYCLLLVTSSSFFALGCIRHTNANVPGMEVSTTNVNALPVIAAYDAKIGVASYYKACLAAHDGYPDAEAVCKKRVANAAGEGTVTLPYFWGGAYWPTTTGKAK